MEELKVVWVDIADDEEKVQRYFFLFALFNMKLEYLTVIK
jgi:hypothetical protein